MFSFRFHVDLSMEIDDALCTVIMRQSSIAQILSADLRFSTAFVIMTKSHRIYTAINS